MKKKLKLNVDELMQTESEVLQRIASEVSFTRQVRAAHSQTHGHRSGGQHSSGGHSKHRRRSWSSPETIESKKVS